MRIPLLSAALVAALASHATVAAAPSTAPATRPTTRPIEQADDGTILLHARDVTVHGKTVRYEPQPNKNTVGYWTKKDDWVSWDFVVRRPGRFRVVILQGCGERLGRLGGGVFLRPAFAQDDGAGHRRVPELRLARHRDGGAGGGPAHAGGQADHQTGAGRHGPATGDAGAGAGREIMLWCRLSSLHHKAGAAASTICYTLAGSRKEGPCEASGSRQRLRSW